MRKDGNSVPPGTGSRAVQPARVSVAVMAHRKRERLVESLTDRLGIDGSRVVWDERENPLDTGRRALLAYDPAASHHLVIQDDAVACRDLLAGLERALPHAGDHPVSLYLQSRTVFSVKAVNDARAGQSSWIVMDGPWWGPALVIPTDQIDDLVAWTDDRHNWPKIRTYDTRIGCYYSERGINCWYTAPSLVDHNPENPSLTGLSSGRARATWFAGADTSALSVNWYTEPIRQPDEPGIAAFRNVQTETIKEVLVTSESYRRMLASPDVWKRISSTERSLDYLRKWGGRGGWPWPETGTRHT